MDIVIIKSKSCKNIRTSLPTDIPEKAKNKRTGHKLLLHLAGLLYRSSDISDSILMIFLDLSYFSPLEAVYSLLCTASTSWGLVQVPTSGHLTQESPVSHNETLNVVASVETSSPSLVPQISLHPQPCLHFDPRHPIAP